MKSVNLFLESIVYKSYIFGEDHSSQERTRIENQIRKIKPDYILSEELGSYRYMTSQEIKNGIRLKRYSNSDRTFKLGLELNTPVIGIDNWTKQLDRLPLSKKFEIRENMMVKTIKEYISKGICCIIVGDAHLRTIETKELGRKSPLNNIPNTIIIRSNNSEIQ